MVTLPDDVLKHNEHFLWHQGGLEGFKSNSMVYTRICTKNRNVVVLACAHSLMGTVKELAQEVAVKTVSATANNQTGSKQIGVINTANIIATSNKGFANITFAVAQPFKYGKARRSSIVELDVEHKRLFVSNLSEYESNRPHGDPYQADGSALGLGSR